MTSRLMGVHGWKSARLNLLTPHGVHNFIPVASPNFAADPRDRPSSGGNQKVTPPTLGCRPEWVTASRPTSAGSECPRSRRLPVRRERGPLGFRLVQVTRSPARPATRPAPQCPRGSRAHTFLRVLSTGAHRGSHWTVGGRRTVRTRAGYRCVMAVMQVGDDPVNRPRLHAGAREMPRRGRRRRGDRPRTSAGWLRSSPR